MLEIGSIVGGRLRIEHILGVGGMGVVAAATHLELGNRVAVKVLRDELAQNPTSVERFIREARAVVNLRTEHVCRVFDVGRLDSGAPYIVMELLAGADLARAIANQPLPVTTAVDYMLQACVAIAEAHAAGIIHRDIKPANLFVTRRVDGGPLLKVLDFGIAKAADAVGPHLTNATGIMGSPGYMSPEQLQSAHDVDARTDIWSLGVTLYELVSGVRPFAAPTLTEMAIKVATDPPPLLRVDPGLAGVIARCLEKEREQRYPTAAALAADLAPFASADGHKLATLAAQLAGGHTPHALPTAPVAADAPTAASIAPAAAAPSRRRPRTPLLVGTVIVVGAAIASAVAVTTLRDAPSKAAPSPTDAAVFALADAAVTADAASETGDIRVGPADLDMVIDSKAKERMAPTCRIAITNKNMTSDPQWALNTAMCYCVLDRIADAQAIVNATKDVDMRNGIRSTCAMYGVKLE